MGCHSIYEHHVVLCLNSALPLCPVNGTGMIGKKCGSVVSYASMLYIRNVETWKMLFTIIYDGGKFYVVCDFSPPKM